MQTGRRAILLIIKVRRGLGPGDPGVADNRGVCNFVVPDQDGISINSCLGWSEMLIRRGSDGEPLEGSGGRSGLHAKADGRSGAND